MVAVLVVEEDSWAMEEEGIAAQVEAAWAGVARAVAA